MRIMSNHRSTSISGDIYLISPGHAFGSIADDGLYLLASMTFQTLSLEQLRTKGRGYTLWNTLTVWKQCLFSIPNTTMRLLFLLQRTCYVRHEGMSRGNKVNIARN